jgi:hypothetical protein
MAAAEAAQVLDEFLRSPPSPAVLQLALHARAASIATTPGNGKLQPKRATPSHRVAMVDGGDGPETPFRYLSWHRADASSPAAGAAHVSSPPQQQQSRTQQSRPRGRTALAARLDEPQAAESAARYRAPQHVMSAAPRPHDASTGKGPRRARKHRPTMA